MNLNHISIQARTRSPWEAIDLGVVMTRQWWLPIFLSWFIPSFSVLIVLSLAFSNYPWVAYLVVWWLKPLWDRGPLYIASRNLFGESVGLREVLLSLPGLYKIEWFQWLTFRRFSVTRSFDVPITVLELLKGQPRSSRQAVLHRSHSSAASWLTIVAVHVEIIITLGMISFVVLMIPESIEIDYLGILIGEETMVVWAEGILSYVSMALVGPFYAMSGFALYISRRIDLEAWDIEIRFRHLAESRKNKMQAGLKQTLLGLLVSLLFVGNLYVLPHTANAETLVAEESEAVVENIQPQADKATVVGDTRTPESQAAKDAIIDVLKGDDFHKVETVKGWRLKDLENPDEDEPKLPEWLLKLLEYLRGDSDSDSSSSSKGGFIALAALLMVYLFWALAIAIVVWVIYRYRNAIQKFTKLTKNQSVDTERNIPSVMFGLDVSAESIPEDIPTTVRDLWEGQQYREAVGLLYRALLSGLIHQHGFNFSDGNTEGECVAIVNMRQQTELTDYTQKLTFCWQQIAYGHLIPDVNDVAGLCRQWEVIFPNE